MRVHKKDPLFESEKVNSITINYDQIDYEMIYENIKEYLVFKISITVDLKERLAYLDVLDYMEQIQLKVNKMKLKGSEK